jgi:hypothetical protein
VEKSVFSKTVAIAFRLPVLLVVAWSTMVCSVRAQEVTLKDAIQCKDFKHAADGSWQAEDVSVSYGTKSKQQQLNLFGSTTVRKGSPVGGVDLWTILNEKCAGR